MSQTRKQIIAIYTLPNISRSKGSQSMKFGQFVEYNMRKSLRKGLGLVSPPHIVYDFSRKIFLTLYSINWLNFIAWLLKLPTKSNKRPETTYSDLKQSTTRTERPTITWNDLQRARNKLKRHTMSKKLPTTTCNKQILTSWNSF